MRGTRRELCGQCREKRSKRRRIWRTDEERTTGTALRREPNALDFVRNAERDARVGVERRCSIVEAEDGSEGEEPVLRRGRGEQLGGLAESAHACTLPGQPQRAVTAVSQPVALTKAVALRRQSGMIL
jgi:hypothetical protein